MINYDMFCGAVEICIFRCCIYRHRQLACERCHLIRLAFGYVQMYGVIIITHYELLITNQKSYQVVIAAGSHLFPFRTEKLSPPAPMVLQCNAGE